MLVGLTLKEAQCGLQTIVQNSIALQGRKEKEGEYSSITLSLAHLDPRFSAGLGSSPSFVLCLPPFSFKAPACVLKQYRLLKKSNTKRRGCQEDNTKTR